MPPPSPKPDRASTVGFNMDTMIKVRLPYFGPFKRNGEVVRLVNLLSPVTVAFSFRKAQKL